MILWFHNKTRDFQKKKKKEKEKKSLWVSAHFLRLLIHPPREFCVCFHPVKGLCLPFNLEPWSLAGKSEMGPKKKERRPKAPLGSQPPTLHESLDQVTAFLPVYHLGEKIKWHFSFSTNNLYKPTLQTIVSLATSDPFSSDEFSPVGLSFFSQPKSILKSHLKTEKLGFSQMGKAPAGMPRPEGWRPKKQEVMF